MELLKDIGKAELYVSLAFILFYALFMFRNYRISTVLSSPFPSVLFFKLLLRTATLSLFIIALLAPSFGTQKAKALTVAKDIFIAVDLSESMKARDVQPSRLEKVKFELKKIIDALPSDRIGLIVFSSEAYIQCPLTYDKNALSLFAETINTDLVPNAGTDFYEPLRLALDKLLLEDETAKNTSKFILLISDGEDFSDRTADIIDELEEKSIKLLTLGVGTEKGAKIPSKRGYKKDNQGNEVVSKLKSDDLKQLAEDTDGTYYEINAESAQTEKLINDIEEIEGDVRESKVVDVENNKYFYFLLLAFILLLVDVSLQLPTFAV